jgi:hypothetical protein
VTPVRPETSSHHYRKLPEVVHEVVQTRGIPLARGA